VLPDCNGQGKSRFQHGRDDIAYFRLSLNTTTDVPCPKHSRGELLSRLRPLSNKGNLATVNNSEPAFNGLLGLRGRAGQPVFLSLNFHRLSIHLHVVANLSAFAQDHRSRRVFLFDLARGINLL
jgi:hypothetical protein